MFQKILPPIADNNYQGRKIALWFFYLITVVTVVRSCIHMFKHDGGAESIATIPLSDYSDGAVGVIIGMFAYWGLSQLMFGIIQVIVALRYRSLIPLMYLMLIVEWGGRLALGMYKPIETTGQAPGGIGNMVLPIVCLVMFFLSINKRES